MLDLFLIVAHNPSGSVLFSSSGPHSPYYIHMGQCVTYRWGCSLHASVMFKGQSVSSSWRWTQQVTPICSTHSQTLHSITNKTEATSCLFKFLERYNNVAKMFIGPWSSCFFTIHFHATISTSYSWFQCTGMRLHN
jgi:hypothetical protein